MGTATPALGSAPIPRTHEHSQPRVRRAASQAGGEGKVEGSAGRGVLPEQAPEAEAAEVLAASGGASAERGPPPGKSELGRAADEGAPAGGGPRAVGPGQGARAPAGPVEEAGEKCRGEASLRSASCRASPSPTCTHTPSPEPETRISEGIILCKRGSSQCYGSINPTPICTPGAGQPQRRSRGEPGQQSSLHIQGGGCEQGQPTLTCWPAGTGWPGPVDTGAKLMAGSGKCCCGSGGRAGGGMELPGSPGCREHREPLTSCPQAPHPARAPQPQ